MNLGFLISWKDYQATSERSFYVDGALSSLFLLLINFINVFCNFHFFFQWPFCVIASLHSIIIMILEELVCNYAWVICISVCYYVNQAKKQICLLVFHGLMSWRLPCILDLTYASVCFLFLVTCLSVTASKSTTLLLHQFCKPPNQMSQLKLFRKLYVLSQFGKRMSILAFLAVLPVKSRGY